MQISKILNPALLLVVLFSLSAAYATDFRIMDHSANTSWDATTLWVKTNTTTPFTLSFTNDASSLNNITQIQFWTTGSGIKLTSVLCQAGWDYSGLAGTTIVCAANTSVLQPGQTVSITATINSVYATTNKLTVWNWVTTDDNSSYTDSGNFSISIDVTGPKVNITTPTEGSTENNSITVNATFVEGEVQVDPATYYDEFLGDCSGLPVAYDSIICDSQNQSCYRTFVINTTSLPIGNCSIIVKINDTFGNEGSYQRNFTFKNDYENPAVTINTPTLGWYKNTISFNVTVDDNYGTELVQLRWENGTDGTWTDLNKGTYWTLDYDVTSLADGNYTFRIRAEDKAGNVNGSETVFDVGIDSTGPTVTIVSPLVGADVTKGDNFDINATVTDAGSGITTTTCLVTIGGRNVGPISYSAGSCVGGVGVPNSMSLGNKDVVVSILDDLGNSGSGTVSVKVIAGSRSSGGSGWTPPINTSTNKSVGEFSNYIPAITAPKIDNESPFVGDTIKCLPGKFSDKDGDMKVSDKWRWYVNGNIINTANKDFLTIDASFKAGDKITCGESASDGKDYSNWVLSSNSAVVQVKEEKSFVQEPTVTPGPDTKPVKPVSGITGAFIGGILEDETLTTMLVVSFVGIVVAFSALHIFNRYRSMDYKVK